MTLCGEVYQSSLVFNSQSHSDADSKDVIGSSRRKSALVDSDSSSDSDQQGMSVALSPDKSNASQVQRSPSESHSRSNRHAAKRQKKRRTKVEESDSSSDDDVPLSSGRVVKSSAQKEQVCVFESMVQLML